jgi:hypothetical protein
MNNDPFHLSYNWKWGFGDEKESLSLSSDGNMLAAPLDSFSLKVLEGACLLCAEKKFEQHASALRDWD